MLLPLTRAAGNMLEIAEDAERVVNGGERGVEIVTASLESPVEQPADELRPGYAGVGSQAIE